MSGAETDWGHVTDSTRIMFEAVWGDQAQQAWEWEDSHPGQGSWQGQTGNEGSSGSSSTSGSSSSGGGGGGSSKKKTSGGDTDNNNATADSASYEASKEYLDKVNEYNVFAKEGDWDQLEAARQQTAKTAANELKFKREQLEKDWFTARANARSQEEQNQIDSKYKEALVTLAEDEHQRLWDTLGFEKTKFGKEFGLEQQKFGLDQQKFAGDLLKTGTEYASSPSKYWMSQDFNAGVNNMLGGGGAAFGNPVSGGGQINSLQDLASRLGLSGMMDQGQGSPSWIGAQAANAPMPGTAGGGPKPAPDIGQAAIQSVIKNWVPSGTQGWDPNDVRALQTIAAIAAQGAHKLAPGSLEGMDKDAKDMFLAGIPRAGMGSSQAFQSAYNLSRPSQGSATAA